MAIMLPAFISGKIRKNQFSREGVAQASKAAVSIVWPCFICTKMRYAPAVGKPYGKPTVLGVWLAEDCVMAIPGIASGLTLSFRAGAGGCCWFCDAAIISAAIEAVPEG